METHPAFEVIYRKSIPEAKAEAIRYRHRKTGADVLSMRAEDNNKTFGITFRTPPTDSTGIAHILEHSVLCGSQKYPMKEPFKELMNGSLYTFLNALTYPDMTVYPVASCNLKDFYNLVDVYLDAVFFPKLGEDVFMQEGWHYDVEDSTGRLLYKGVVFNEMKGAYSSADAIASEAMFRSLFPESTYGMDSGGNPASIPDLTYEQFERFHREHYHPSNSLVYFYGDDPELRRLEILDSYFSQFDSPGKIFEVTPQPPFTQPIEIEKSYAASGEAASEGCFATFAWKLKDCTHLDSNSEWGILDRLLLGSPASPLRRALMESDLGEDLTGGGFQADGLHSVFAVGLKGLDEEDIPEAYQRILQTLEKISREGFDPELLEAVLNRMDFHLRENDTGSSPPGLVLLFRALTLWRHGVDPAEALSWGPHFAAVKERIQNDPALFQNLIRRDLLENPHRIQITVRPDSQYEQKLQEQENQRLTNECARMNPQQIEQVRHRAEELRKKQQQPDSPEALATLPHLDLEDLDRLIETIPKESQTIYGVDVLFHPQPTNGIVYVDIVFDLNTLPQHLLPLLPLFTRCLTELGTTRHDFAALAQWIGRKTGGLSESLYTETHYTTRERVAKLIFRGKAMADRLDDLMQIFEETLLTTHFDQPAKILEFVQEDKSIEESRIIPSGHSFIQQRMAAHLDAPEALSEILDGFEQVRFLRTLVPRCKTDWPGLLRDLEEMRHILINRRGMLINLTCDPSSMPHALRRTDSFVQAIPERPFLRQAWDLQRPPPAEALRYPSPVNYVGRAFNIFQHGYTLHGSSQVARLWLNNSWLWDKVRVQGGAYGAFCGINPNTGILSFTSYRDPAVASTIHAYHAAGEALLKNTPTGSDLKQNIIGAWRPMATPVLPKGKGYTSLLRHINGMTDDLRQRIRDEILETTPTHLRAFAECLKSLSGNGALAVLGSGEKIAEAAAFARDGKLVYTDLFEE